MGLPVWLETFINTYLVRFVINLVFAALILLIGFKLAKWISAKIVKSKGFKHLAPETQSFLSNVIGVVIKILVVISAIVVLGVPEASIVAALGSCGLAIGLALQGGLSNIAGGLIIMVCRPFHIGDYVEFGGTEGVVSDIGVYYTKLKTPDNRDISVPNSIVANASVNNYSTESVRRVDFDFRIAYTADIDLARKVLLATASMNDLVLKDPAPAVLVGEHGESAITVKLRVWTNTADYWTVYFDMWEDVKKAFDKFSIDIPYSRLNVVLGDREQ